MILSNDRYTVDTDLADVVQTGVSQRLGIFFWSRVKFTNNFVAYKSRRTGKFFITMRKSDGEDNLAYKILQKIGLHPVVTMGVELHWTGDSEDEMVRAMRYMCDQDLIEL